ncbi:MAG: hypothetical protein ACFBZ8_11160 [Opitutales bacterium]
MTALAPEHLQPVSKRSCAADVIGSCAMIFPEFDATYTMVSGIKTWQYFG